MGIFDGVLICTDLDGTLLRNDKTISDANVAAIEYFKANGGYFTFVTGRMPFFVSDIYERINPNAPFGCVNGAGIYDYGKDEYVYTAKIHDSVIDLVEYIDKRFSNIGIQVNTYYKTYFCRENQTMERFRRVTGVENLVCRYRDVNEPVAKIVFGSEDESDIMNIKAALDSHSLAEKFSFIRSERTFYEILPKGIGKGNAIEQLCKHLNVDIKKSIAIGDYNNDISMFRAAGIGVAVANACEDALRAADYITVSNEEDAIARVIYDLKEHRLL